jgi:hypothetical protein
MKGRKRLRKKLLKEAGWENIEEQGGNLVLRNTAGEELEFKSASRPRAYQQALEKIKANRGHG